MQLMTIFSTIYSFFIVALASLPSFTYALSFPHQSSVLTSNSLSGNNSNGEAASIAAASTDRHKSSWAIYNTGIPPPINGHTNIVDLQQLKHLKISRYMPGQEFSKHRTLEGAPVSRGWEIEEDFFGDVKRPVLGCMSSCNKPNHNNFLTVLVYLNDIPSGKGGRTTFPNIGIHQSTNGDTNGGSFYDCPTPMDSQIRADGSPWDWEYGQSLTISPQKGMGLLHFPSLTPEYGGICDGNTFHKGDKPDDGYEKFVCQQFISSCPVWDIPDDSMPIGRVSHDTI